MHATAGCVTPDQSERRDPKVYLLWLEPGMSTDIKTSAQHSHFTLSSSTRSKCGISSAQPIFFLKPTNPKPKGKVLFFCIIIIHSYLHNKFLVMYASEFLLHSCNLIETNHKIDFFTVTMIAIIMMVPFNCSYFKICILQFPNLGT